MFSIPLMDASLYEVKLAAEKDNFYALLHLATCLSRGEGMPCNEAQALEILEYILAEEATIPEEHRQIYWNSLVEKSAIYQRCFEAEGEEKYYVLSDGLMEELIGDMTRFPADRWNLLQLSHAAQWLYHRSVASSENTPAPVV